MTSRFYLMRKVPNPPTKYRNPKTEHRIEIFFFFLYLKVYWLYATNAIQSNSILYKIVKTTIYTKLEASWLHLGAQLHIKFYEWLSSVSRVPP